MRQIAVQVGAQTVHLRRVGQGRPVVLLHESPRSSHVLMDLAERMKDRFTVLAFDTPGYGLSDPMPLERPSIDDFADVLAGAMRALGVRQVPVYGIHTGATIGARMAVRHPDLVSGLVFDGYPLFSEQERATHEAFYLPNYAPRWDGGHILALWSRIRDQHSHFPWYLRSRGAKLDYDWSLQRMRGVFHDMLRAGPHYLTAYSSSFRFDGGQTLNDLDAGRVPYHLIARAQDVLSPHLDRFSNLPAICSVQTSPPDPEGWAQLVVSLLDRLEGQAELPPFTQSVTPSLQGALAIGAGNLACRVYGPPDAAVARIFLHPAGESGRLLADAARRAALTDVVIVPELLTDGADIALGLTDILDRLGFAMALVSGAGLPPSDCFTPDPTPLPRAPVAPVAPEREPPLPPRLDGADLVAVWFRLRDAELAGTEDELFAGADIHRLHARFVAAILATEGGY